MTKFMKLIAVCLLLSGAPVYAQTVATGSLTTNGQETQYLFDANVPGGNVFVSGTWTGTLTFQVLIGANAGTWTTIPLFDISDSTMDSTTTANGVWLFSNPGWRGIKAIATDTMTGTAVVAISRGVAVTAAGSSSGGSGGTQYAEDAVHASGNTGTVALAVRNDAGTALAADGDNSVLQVDSAGALRVTGGGGGTQYAEDAAHASGNTGTLMLGVRRDTAASSTATDGDNATFNFDATGHLYTATTISNGSAVDANNYAVAVNGASATSTLAGLACNVLSAASTNATSCKASAGNFYGYEFYNTTTTVYYLRLYNLAAAPTCSSATGFVRSIPIPPASAAGGVGGAIVNLNIPVNFTTGIAYCLTASSASTSNDNAATGIFGEIRYK